MIGKISTASVRFNVVGVPAPQGSKRQVTLKNGRRLMIEANTKTRPWRDSIAAAALRVAEDYEQFDGPLTLHVRFRFSMPKSRKKADRMRGWCWKQSTPDLDKLIRAVGDSLTASGLIRDDARFCRIVAEKIEILNEWTGAEISIARFTEQP